MYVYTIKLEKFTSMDNNRTLDSQDI